MSGYIYAFQIGDDGPIKIGFTTNVEKRKKGIETSTPYDLSILLNIPGTKTNECWTHSRLRPHRLRGEWFYNCEEVLRFLDRMSRKDFKWPSVLNRTERAPSQRNSISDEMHNLVKDVLGREVVGETVNKQILRASELLGLPLWRVKAAWYCEAGCWSAVVVDEFRLRCGNLIAARSSLKAA